MICTEPILERGESISSESRQKEGLVCIGYCATSRRCHESIIKSRIASASEAGTYCG